MIVPVQVTHLEMTLPDQLSAVQFTPPDVDIVFIEQNMPELNRFFYTAIGGDWFWVDCLKWSYQEWKDYFKRENIKTWMFTVKKIPAGYLELAYQDDGNVEIRYFGLLSNFTGKGLPSGIPFGKRF